MTFVYVERSQRCMQEVFEDLGCTITPYLEKADVAVLIGGADISSSWYNAPSHPKTYGNINRDDGTKTIYDAAISLGIPILGICRGAQFINAMQGGGMYQDVDNHNNGEHLVWDLMSKSYHKVNSIHHQMMIPTDKAIKVAYAVDDDVHEGLCTHRDLMKWSTDKEEVMLINVPSTSIDPPEWEVLLYPEAKALCFQAHPEYGTKEGSCRTYFNELLYKYFPNEFGDKNV